MLKEAPVDTDLVCQKASQISVRCPGLPEGGLVAKCEHVGEGSAYSMESPSGSPRRASTFLGIEIAKL